MADDSIGIGSRREGRETVLGLLYEAELTEREPSAVVEAQSLPVDPFAEEMLRGIESHQPELDELLERYSRGWSVERMPIIDRLVLRMGAYELAHRPDIPPGAVLSEAVDLVAQYSTEKSSTFVNGLLARIAEEVRD